MNGVDSAACTKQDKSAACGHGIAHIRMQSERKSQCAPGGACAVVLSAQFKILRSYYRTNENYLLR